MVHKDTARTRGRPRAYDPDEALGRATQAFWERGYAGTSLDQLSDATDMNRPSLYAAFGDKRALYLQTLDRYVHNSKDGLERALAADVPLCEGLHRLYERALALYFPAGDAPRGCYLIGTAVTEALSDEEVRDKLGAALHDIHRTLAARMQLAKEQGELDASADPAALAMVASSVMYAIAIRSRAGDSRASLRAAAEVTVQLICGTPPRRRAQSGAKGKQRKR